MTLKELAERRLAAHRQAENSFGRDPARDVSPPPPDGRDVKQVASLTRGGGDLGRVIARLGCTVPEELAHLSLGEFSGAGRLVEGRPGPDGEPLLFASDNAAPDPGETRVVYRGRELRALRGLPAGMVRDLHRMKCAFGATLEVN
jgi:hypothetical protein